MIDWLYQSTLDISILIVLILLIRNPARRFIGAHISYWLWSLPLFRIVISTKFNRPDVITRYLEVPESNDIIPIYSGPIQATENQIEFITLIWLLGISAWILTKTYQTIRFKLLLLNHSKMVPHDDNIIPTTLLKQFNFKIQVRISSAVNGPLITGLIKPTIYLPVNFSESYTSNQRYLILEHELTHAKRLDLWAQLLAEIFKAVFWFNPLVHLAWAKFQQDQEFACDHQILKNASSKTRQDYGEALKKGLSALLTPNSLTFFNHKHERFVMLNKHKTNGFITLSGVTFIALIALIMFTKTGVSFTEKNMQTHGGIISFKFEGIPLNNVAMLIADAAKGEISFQNQEVLNDIMVTANAERVHAYDFFDALLNDHGLKVDRNDSYWHFYKL